MIFHFGCSFRAAIFSNEWSWRDILLVKILARLLTPNLVASPNKGYFWLSEKMTKVSCNRYYRAWASFKSKLMSVRHFCANRILCAQKVSTLDKRLVCRVVYMITREHVKLISPLPPSSPLRAVFLSISIIELWLECQILSREIKGGSIVAK